jgi:hypothetical protein
MRFVKLLIGIILFSVSPAFALLSLPDSLISLNSPQGEKLLEGANNKNYLQFLEQIVTQKNQAYCGVASSVIVLNALAVPAPVDPAYRPYSYFTQDNFFSPTLVKILPPSLVSHFGMTLAMLQKALNTFPVRTNIFYANNIDESKFRKIAKNALTDNKGVIVNFYRPTLNEPGGGHFSPLAAYNEKFDKFLLLDVARYKYGPYWVTTSALVKAMQTMDKTSKKSRGFIVVSPEKLVLFKVSKTAG